MCVIVIKDKNKDLPNKSLFRECWNKNPHGAGYMYAKRDKVYIRKGFMNFDTFYEDLNEMNQKENLFECSVIFHFRISTSGNISPQTCHPYPVSENILDLQRKKKICKLGVCHNGTIGIFREGLDGLNDTQLFIQNVLSVYFKANKIFYQNNQNLDTIYRISNLNSNSKFAFLDSKGNIKTIGQFSDYQGYRFSNLFFRKSIFVKNHYQQLKKFDTELFPIEPRRLEKIPKNEMKDLYKDIRNNLEILSADEKIWSEDLMCEYRNDEKHIYGYDPVSFELYLVDDKNKTLSFIDYVTI